MKSAHLAVAVLAALALSAAAQDAPRPPARRPPPDQVPRYELPPGAERVPALPAALAAAVDEALAELRDPPHPEAAAESARLIATVGAAALPAVVRALDGASWHVRASLVAALAEMETPLASPLLRTAASDPSFAVREGAVTGLGKIGEPGAADTLLSRVDPAGEPVWRVRAASAAAIRRALLRGVLDRTRGDDALARLLDDPDPDVRLAALREVPHVGSDAALPALLDMLADGQTEPEERSLAVAALRVARHRADDVTAALRRGFLEEDDPARAGEAGAALLDLQGVDALADDDVSGAILHHLVDAGQPHLRAALGRLGTRAAPWLAAEARGIARRIATGRIQHSRSPLEMLVEALVEVRRAEAAALALELATGPDAAVLEPETRRFALRQVRNLGAAAAAGQALRKQFDSAAGDGVRRELLETIVASGGDDLGARLDAALAHSDPAARFVAVDLLARRPDLPAGAGLERLAVDPDASERLRGAALDALAQRDPNVASVIARELVTHARAAVRERAVGIVGRSGTAEDIALLLARLAAEDGADPADDADTDRPDENVARTPSGRDSTTRRARIRKAILTALRDASPERARSALFAALEDDDPALRERAARLLRGIVGDADAAALVARLAAESGPVHDAILGLLATLDGNAAAERVFDVMLARDGDRHRALAPLRASDARIAPPALTTGLTDPDWDDDDREIALTILARHGRVPDVALLVRLARGSTTVELASEAMRLLAASPDPTARAALGELLRTFEDIEKLAEAAQRIGELESAAMVPELIDLLERWHAPALEAARGSAAAVRLYRNAAVALGRSGTAEGRGALVRHVLDGRTARAVAVYGVAGDGPFRPLGAAPVRCVRGLISGLAHTPDATLRQLLERELGIRARDGAAQRLSEEYVDGIARYLRDPEAYGLPARRRPSAAFPLLELVVALPPRLSANDLDARFAIAAQLQEETRYAESAAAHAALLALRDVEDAERGPDRRRDEVAKQTVLEALAALAAGRPEAALAAVDAVRAPDPESGDLAYWHGYGRLKLGHVDEATRASLVLAVAADERNPTRHLYLGWLVQQNEGPAASVAYYERAKRLDRERVHASGGEYLTHRRGRVHLWGFYPYYLARALAAAGDREHVLDEVASAIARDDRYAEQALADPLLAALPGLAEAVTAARQAIKASDTD